MANQVLFGQPLAGRRAYDVIRTLDYLGLRRELNAGDITVIGLGDDALPVLLAAAVDSRIKRIAVVHHVHSFVPQMQHMPLHPAAEMRHGWNSSQLDGRIHAGGAEIDSGSVIPSALRYAELPDLLALIAPGKFLFCEACDGHEANFDIQSRRFQRIMESAGSAGRAMSRIVSSTESFSSIGCKIRQRSPYGPEA